MEPRHPWFCAARLSGSVPRLMARHLPLLALALAACVHGPIRRPQRRPDWLLLESPHYSLRAQLSETEAREQLALLEGLYAAFASRPAWAALQKLGPLRVVLVEDASALQEFFGDRRATFSTSDSFGETLIVSGGLHVQAINRALLHATAHVLDDAAFPALPQWLSEGLAGRAEGLRVREGEIVLGSGDDEAFALLQRNRRVNAAILLGARPPGGFEREGFDVWAWLATQTLWARDPQAMMKYLLQLSQAVPEEQAFRAAFPEATFARDVNALRAGAPKDAITHVPVPAVTGPARALYAGEVHAVRAQLFELAGRKDAARVEAALALQTAPGDPAALAIFRGNPAAAIEDRPRDARAFLLYADAMKGAARKAALRVAASLAPQSPGPFLRLADDALEAHDEDALGYAAAAVERGRTLAALDGLARARCAAGDAEGAGAAWTEALLRAGHAEPEVVAALGAHDAKACVREGAAQTGKAAMIDAPAAAPRACAATPPSGGARGVVFAEYRVGEDGRAQDLAVLDDSPRAAQVRAFLESCTFPAQPGRVTAPFVFPGEP